MSNTLNDIADAAHENACAKGFYDTPPNIPERLALIHSEVSEALEDYRDGKMSLVLTDSGKPIGFPSELADILIRVLDLAAHLGIDADHAVRVKMEYNSGRPHKHGRKVL